MFEDLTSMIRNESPRLHYAQLQAAKLGAMLCVNMVERSRRAQLPAATGY